MSGSGFVAGGEGGGRGGKRSPLSPLDGSSTSPLSSYTSSSPSTSSSFSSSNSVNRHNNVNSIDNDNDNDNDLLRGLTRESIDPSVDADRPKTSIKLLGANLRSWLILLLVVIASYLSFRSTRVYIDLLHMTADDTVGHIFGNNNDGKGDIIFCWVPRDDHGRISYSTNNYNNISSSSSSGNNSNQNRSNSINDRTSTSSSSSSSSSSFTTNASSTSTTTTSPRPPMPIFQKFSDIGSLRFNFYFIDCFASLDSGLPLIDKLDRNFSSIIESSQVDFAVIGKAPWSKSYLAPPHALVNSRSLLAYFEKVLAPKAIPINNWKRLAKFCDLSNVDIVPKSGAPTELDIRIEEHSRKRPVKTCFILVKGSRVAKIHSDIEKKIVAAFPNYRFIEVDGSKYRFSFENPFSIKYEHFAYKLYALRRGTHYLPLGKAFLYDNVFDFVKTTAVADTSRFIAHNNNHVEDYLEAYKLLRSNSTYFKLKYGRKKGIDDDNEDNYDESEYGVDFNDDNIGGGGVSGGKGKRKSGESRYFTVSSDPSDKSEFEDKDRPSSSDAVAAHSATSFSMKKALSSDVADGSDATLDDTDGSSSSSSNNNDNNDIIDDISEGLKLSPQEQERRQQRLLQQQLQQQQQHASSFDEESLRVPKKIPSRQTRKPNDISDDTSSSKSSSNNNNNNNNNPDTMSAAATTSTSTSTSSSYAAGGAIDGVASAKPKFDENKYYKLSDLLSGNPDAEPLKEWVGEGVGEEGGKQGGMQGALQATVDKDGNLKLISGRDTIIDDNNDNDNDNVRRESEVSAAAVLAAVAEAKTSDTDVTLQQEEQKQEHEQKEQEQKERVHRSEDDKYDRIDGSPLSPSSSSSSVSAVDL